MKKFLLYSFATLSMFACKESKKSNKQNITENTSKKTEKSISISEESVQKSLEYLASDDLKGRKFGTPGIEKASDYIQKEFESAGLEPYFETYQDSFNHQGKMGYNMVGFKKGSDPKLKNEIVILGAHYDHIGVVPEERRVAGDSIANGANDNAAGTVSVLELAKYFSTKKTKRSIMFVLFSAEEMGLIGSKHLAKKLAEENAPVYLLLNFEMIGVPLKNKDHKAYLTGYEMTNMAEKFNEYAGEKVLGFSEKSKEYELFKHSDNYAFFLQMNIPSQTISTFDFTNFDYYHHVDDEADKLNASHMKSLIEAVIPGIEGMVNSTEKEIQLNENN